MLGPVAALAALSALRLTLVVAEASDVLAVRLRLTSADAVALSLPAVDSQALRSEAEPWSVSVLVPLPETVKEPVTPPTVIDPVGSAEVNEWPLGTLSTTVTALEVLPIAGEANTTFEATPVTTLTCCGAVSVRVSAVPVAVVVTAATVSGAAGIGDAGRYACPLPRDRL